MRNQNHEIENTLMRNSTSKSVSEKQKLAPENELLAFESETKPLIEIAVNFVRWRPSYIEHCAYYMPVADSQDTCKVTSLG